jgi:uncharacterized tellurite resistance protein B-like protein
MFKKTLGQIEVSIQLLLITFFSTWHNFSLIFLKLILMENEEKILQDHSDLEKGAYLGAIASIATADRSASPEELEYLAGLCDAANLSERQKAAVVNAATDDSGQNLPQYLDILKTSDLKYSLVADLMAFAKSDTNYSEREEQNIEKISQYLGLDKRQASLLDEFSDKAASVQASPQEMKKPGFLSMLGLGDKMQNAGINGGSFLKGLLGMAAPMILGGLLSGGMNRSRTSNSGMFGGGGLGSLIGMLSGGRGMRSTGGLFGRLLGGV